VRAWQEVTARASGNSQKVFRIRDQHPISARHLADVGLDVCFHDAFADSGRTKQRDSDEPIDGTHTAGAISLVSDDHGGDWLILGHFARTIPRGWRKSPRALTIRNASFCLTVMVKALRLP
jgi:hypothetical protein